jgi:hypothetical protein
LHDPLPPPEPFDPETLQTLASAYDKALAALDAAGADEHYRVGAALARHRLARQIVQMGRHGERDPDRLQLGALTELRRTSA